VTLLLRMIGARVLQRAIDNSLNCTLQKTIREHFITSNVWLV
jgi:hypothetical protein